jgi:hypothetical protein
LKLETENSSKLSTCFPVQFCYKKLNRSEDFSRHVLFLRAGFISFGHQNQNGIFFYDARKALMELKLVCGCGQKYKFDVEPVNQQMPFDVNCPVCGIDGTPFANALLAQAPPPPPTMAVPPRVTAAAPPLPPPVPVAASARPMPAPRSAPGTTTHPAPAIPKYLQTNAATAYNSFPLGMLGAFLGAIGGAVLIIGIYKLLGFRISYLCVVIGPITGLCARLMYRGTDSSLGLFCALVAFLTIGAVLFLSFGLIGTLLVGFIVLTIGTSLAFKVAS